MFNQLESILLSILGSGIFVEAHSWIEQHMSFEGEDGGTGTSNTIIKKPCVEHGLPNTYFVFMRGKVQCSGKMPCQTLILLWDHCLILFHLNSDKFVGQKQSHSKVIQ